MIAAHQKEEQAADAEARLADRNLSIAEGVKTAASYSLTGMTMYATAGLASPVSLILPTCAESAVSATYSMATGYIELPKGSKAPKPSKKVLAAVAKAAPKKPQAKAQPKKAKKVVKRAKKK